MSQFRIGGGMWNLKAKQKIKRRDRVNAYITEDDLEKSLAKIKPIEKSESRSKLRVRTIAFGFDERRRMKQTKGGQEAYSVDIERSLNREMKKLHKRKK